MANLGRRLFGAALAGAGAGIVEQAAQRRQDKLLALRRKWQVEDREAGAALTREGWGRADARAAADRDATDALTREGWDRADARSAANQPLVPIVGEDGSPIYSTRTDAVGQGIPAKQGTRAPSRPVEVVDPNTGRTILVPPEEAYGMSPPGKDKSDTKLYVLSEDPMTGARTYGTREDALAAGQGSGEDPQTNEALQERAEAAFDALGPEWYESFDWINPAVDSDEKAAGASKEEFVARLMEAIERNPGVPDAELARQLAAEFTGRQQGGGSDLPEARPAPTSGPPADHPNAQQAPDGNWYVPAGDGKWRRVQ